MELQHSNILKKDLVFSSTVHSVLGPANETVWDDGLYCWKQGNVNSYNSACGSIVTESGFLSLWQHSDCYLTDP